MRVVVVTGLSGSGKSTALRALEDLGFYAVDNLPIELLDKLVELFGDSGGEIEKLAFVVDARALQVPATTRPKGHEELAKVPHALEVTRQAGHEVDLLFCDADDEVVERRYSETRRRHPLSGGGSVKAGIAAEREILDQLRRYATDLIDTTEMSVHDLKRWVKSKYERGSSVFQLSVTVVSFGFKNGVPHEADLMFDVRFLPNPHFVEDLRPLSGEDQPVKQYVLETEEARSFMAKLTDLLAFLVPHYEHEGKAYLTIGIGCTGGRHRSVAVTEALAEWLRSMGRPVQVRHRDLLRREMSGINP